MGRFVVDGKVSSLNSFLTPDSKYYGYDSYENIWLPDVDGSYGENDSGIFFLLLTVATLSGLGSIFTLIFPLKLILLLLQ